MSGAVSSKAHPILVVVIDGRPHLEYDRGKALAERHSAYLDRMDRQMDTGVRMDGAWIEHPNPLQRAQFVAIHLIQALQQADEAPIAASCAYLANRLPDLKQVKAGSVGNGFSVELVFDKSHVKETTVNFIPRPAF